jgi:general secretion pathway protein C
MMARWLAFTVWAAVAASAVFWGLKFFVRPAAAPAHAGVAAPTTALRGDLTRLLGADPPPAAAEEEPVEAESSRFQLLGVVAPRGAGSASQGVALIAVDGKPPRAYKVGAVVDGSQVLQSVQARGVSIGPRGGAVAVSLEIPPQPPAATGSLPAATSGAPTALPLPKPGLVLPLPTARPPMPGVARFPGNLPTPANNLQGGGAGGGANGEPPQNDGPATR